MVKIAQPTEAQQIQLLEETYHNATKKGGLIEFTSEIRTPKKDLSGKYSVTLTRVNKLFNDGGWVERATKSGHLKFEHSITHVMVEYGNHIYDVDPGAAQTIFEQVQEHLNIMCNEIFQYRCNHWKTKPDYQAALARLNDRV